MYIETSFSMKLNRGLMKYFAFNVDAIQYSNIPLNDALSSSCEAKTSKLNCKYPT